MVKRWSAGLQETQHLRLIQVHELRRGEEPLRLEDALKAPARFPRYCRSASVHNKLSIEIDAKQSTIPSKAVTRMNDVAGSVEASNLIELAPPHRRNDS